MIIDLYMPIDCIWYSLIALYLIGYVICARKLYPKLITNSNCNVDRIFTYVISLIFAILWPIAIVNALIFYGVKNEND
jgi:hypothetical protein